MAAPVGHIFSVLLLLQVKPGLIEDKNALFVGASFPDIRYITEIDRKTTHSLAENSLDFVLNGEDSFEKGRRFHVWLDLKREKYMQSKNAYNFVKEEPRPTHMLKLVEDHLLYPKIKQHFDPKPVFNKAYAQEKAFGLSDESIKDWHSILISYLDTTSSFSLLRYITAYNLLKNTCKKSGNFFLDLIKNTKTLFLAIIVYYKMERLSRNEELRRIILDFYEQELPALIKHHTVSL